MLSFGYKYKNCKHKIVKSVHSPLKYLCGGLGGPPIFVACQSISVRNKENKRELMY
jgi:hypothetical protein